MTRLVAATTRFAARYQARADLVAEQRGWDCVIALIAADSGEGATVRVTDGLIAAVSDGAELADLIVSADGATLLDVLELRRGPNEPYLFGELTVRGREEDFLRLDYVTEALCPR
jgi:hypothetical protein